MTTKATSAFLTAVTSHDAKTANGAVSHSTSGKASVDYFAKSGTYRGRTADQVGSDMAAIWKENPLLAVSLGFYTRMVTRKTKTLEGVSEKVQKGQGAKDEFIKVVEFLEKKHPTTLYKNLWLVPAAGCWKDLWYDSPATGHNYYVNPKEVYELIKRGIQDEANRSLIAKYLPRIRSKKDIKNDRHRRQKAWSMGLCKHLGWSPVDYRKFKSDPKNTAHLWQRQMCKGLWSSIDFGKISGKALFEMVSAKGKDKKTILERHGLEAKYEKWLDKQPIAKFTGYVYELYLAAKGHGLSKVQEMTYNKQFEGLLELARKDEGGIKGNVWCALDTSGSMSTGVQGTQAMAVDIGVSLGIYFSALNEGAFKNHVIMFDSTSRVRKLTGTFCDRIKQVPQDSMGGTNFQSVINEIVRVRQAYPTIPVSEFPETLLVVSDMQFNPTGSKKTNYETAMKKLKAVGLGDIKVIWWYVVGTSKEVPNKADDEGTTIMSGFDPSAVQLILGGDQTVVDDKTGKVRALNPYENMLKALDQEIIAQLEV